MEATIGFDLRSVVSDPSWTVDRRTRYLLRPDVPSVRSVDTLVWERPPGLPRPPVPEGLWPNLSDLFAAAGALDRADVVAVRITAFPEEEEDGPTPQIEPAVERYDLLGYDVADYWQLSGLTNCGYSPEEAASLAPRLGASPQRMAPVRQSRRCGSVRGCHGQTSAGACAVLRLRHLPAALISQPAASLPGPSPRVLGPSIQNPKSIRPNGRGTTVRYPNPFPGPALQARDSRSCLRAAN